MALIKTTHPYSIPKSSPAPTTPYINKVILQVLEFGFPLYGRHVPLFIVKEIPSSLPSFIRCLLNGMYLGEHMGRV